MASRLIVSTWKNGNHAYSLDGERVPAVSTVCGALEKQALRSWYARMAAEWCANHPGELEALGFQAFVERAVSAPDTNRDAAAVTGQNLHHHAHTLATTGQVDVAGEDLTLVEQAVDFLDRLGVKPVVAEQPVFHAEHRYAGRLDLVADIAGEVWLLDYKTGQSGVWPDVALQLAAYRFASHMASEDPDTDDVPMVPVGHTGVVWVRPEGWQLIPVRADREVWETFLGLIPARRFLNASRNRDNYVAAPAAAGRKTA